MGPNYAKKRRKRGFSLHNSTWQFSEVGRGKGVIEIRGANYAKIGQRDLQNEFGRRNSRFGENWVWMPCRSFAAAAMNIALSEGGAEEEDETTEDKINRIVESRKLLPNASYFAFTATPKNKTLEIFGEPYQDGGETKHRPFHGYTMKQAIQEGFILDVLKCYTPIASYYKLVKAVEADPEFDTKRAKKKLRKYVESHDHAIRLKAEIMVDHFHEQVMGLKKIGGQARAMVVTSGIERAIQYFHAIRDYLIEIKSQHRAIVAFSGEPEYGGQKVTEASLNGFPSGKIAKQIQQHPYRFLICADKFQTGYDEPLLHTMYVDKPLSGIKAVQTLSRLNRAHPKKHDVFVLDFMNDVDTIQTAFADYYRTTILSKETDPNKLHDLKNDLDSHQIYSQEQIDELVSLYLDGADRESWTRFWTPVWRHTTSSSTRTGRSTSRARPRGSVALTTSWPRFCPTPTPAGSGCRSSSTSWYPSCRHGLPERQEKLGQAERPHRT